MPHADAHWFTQILAWINGLLFANSQPITLDLLLTQLEISLS